MFKGRHDEEINWVDTTIDIGSLTQWLKSKNVNDSFFTDNANFVLGFADRDSSFYAPKLAAAVQAWTEVTNNPELLKNKTPKAALDKWLREHAAEYGLTNDSGNPNNQGISEICKIANWKPEGGATPTVTKVTSGKTATAQQKSGGRQLRQNPTTRSSKAAPTSFATDEDMPF